MPVSDQGVNLDRYMFVPRTLIILQHEDRILLIKGSPKKRLWAGLYNGVGGHVEQNEDIYTAARRELREETGLVTPNLSLCGILTVDTQTNPGVCVFVFTGNCEEAELVQSEEGCLEWVKLSEIGILPTVIDIPLIIPKIISFKNDAQIFFAHSEYDKNGQMVITFT